MNAKERAAANLRRYTPSRNRKLNYFGLLGGIFGEKPNKTRSVVDRWLDSYHGLNRSLHYLAGVMTLLPSVPSNRRVQFQDDGDRLMEQATDFIDSEFEKKDVSVSSVRKLRVFSEKIIKLTEKIKRDLGAE